jgi:PAS domain S-box-containing protein
MTLDRDAPFAWGNEHGLNPWIPPELLKRARAAAPEHEAARLRKERRYVVNQPAQLVAASREGGIWPVRIRDISRHGMQLMTDEPVLAPPHVRIRWNGRDVAAIIRYNHKCDLGGYRIGIELDTLSDDLMREVLACQSEELRDANAFLAHQAGLARQYAALLDLVSDAVAVLAPDGTVLFWNKPAERLYGWTRAEIVGRNLGQFIPSEPFAHLPGSGATSPEQHLRQFRKNGAPVLVGSRRTVEKDSAGNTQAILFINREILP